MWRRYYGQRDVGVGAVRDAEARGVVNWGGGLMAPLTRRRARARRGSGLLRECQREEEDDPDVRARVGSGSQRTGQSRVRRGLDGSVWTVRSRMDG